MDFLYKTGELSHIFHKHFCGPDLLPHSEDVLIAKFGNDLESDGYGVEVYCCAMPAQFFTIKILDSVNSVGEMRKGWSMVTGSGCQNEAYTIAKMIQEGMLGLKRPK